MIKITFIIPYDEIENDVFNLIDEVKEEGVMFKTIKLIGTHDIIREYDSDIIIARGVTYLALKKHLKDISVIEIAVTGYDVIRAIDDCKKKFNPKKIAVIGSETMVFGADSLEEIMGVSIETFKIESEEDALYALDMASKNGAEAIVGGLTTFRLARSMGWKCVWIKTGKEAVRQAINDALSTASAIRLERTKSELFKIILEHTKEATIAVDENGIITAVNKAAYKILKVPYEKKLIGLKVMDFLPDPDLLRVIKTGEEELGVINTFNDTVIVSNRIPIKVGLYNVGELISFQNVDKIQEIESKIRKELSNKGLFAKYSFGNIIGKSEEIKRSIGIAYKYSQVDSNILLIGETGTGKELFAQSIHNASSRKFEPFVAVNCAALPENLLESELFGYVEGAFSGASKGGKIGLFELAHRGTIFLDEVGEISLNLQAKLLRVLQEKEIRKIGDDRVIPIDIRIISATNIDLLEKVRTGSFRQDLLYRLDVLNLKIPPLRERKDDIKSIAEHFIEKYCRQFGKNVLTFSSEALEAMVNYNWPGNIRELKNICERLVVLADSKSISKEDVISLIGKFDFSERGIHVSHKIHDEQIVLNDDFEDILMLMKAMKINKTEMAKILGISRTTLWRKLKEKS